MRSLLDTRVIDPRDDRRSDAQVSAHRSGLREDLDLAVQASVRTRPLAGEMWSRNDGHSAVQASPRSSPAEGGFAAATANDKTAGSAVVVPFGIANWMKIAGRIQVLLGMVVEVESMGYKVRSGGAIHHVSAAAMG